MLADLDLLLTLNLAGGLHPVPSVSGLAVPGGHLARSLCSPTALSSSVIQTQKLPRGISDAAGLLVALSHETEVAFASDGA